MNEVQHVEQYLQGTLIPEEQLLMEAQLLIDPELNDKLDWQQKTYALIRAYGRKKLKEEIEQVQKRMFSEEKFKNFRQKIQRIFKQ